MDLLCTPCPPWLRAVVLVALLAVHRECHACEPSEKTPKKADKPAVARDTSRDVRSRHFLLHTDLPAAEADGFIERLESVLGHFSHYWGRPMRGSVECYIMRDYQQFPSSETASAAVHGVKTHGGVTLMEASRDGKRQVAKSSVYAAARLEVVQHEAVHAYCHQTFGRVGPVWYCEGMAEIGRYWNDEDTAVRADAREIEFLRNNPPKSLAEPLSSAQRTGDSWQNYASRWALCHFLANNPNYSRRFRHLGRSLLAGKDVGFDQTFGNAHRRLLFEYLLFLQHIDRGYRVDLCAWDWKKKFDRLKPGGTLNATVAAARGWQASGLTIRSGAQYEYIAGGAWQTEAQAEAVDARGGGRGLGRLVGAVMKDFQLGPEFELGTEGSLQLKADGDLYLRCRDGWNELADNLGHVSIKFQLSTGGATCPTACADRQ